MGLSPGAIAGIIIGSIIGLIVIAVPIRWFFLQRRHHDQGAQHPQYPMPPSYTNETNETIGPLDPHSHPPSQYEVPPGIHTAPSEGGQYVSGGYFQPLRPSMLHSEQQHETEPAESIAWMDEGMESSPAILNGTIGSSSEAAELVHYGSMQVKGVVDREDTVRR